MNTEDYGWSLSYGKSKHKAFVAHAHRCDPLVHANRSCLDFVLDHDLEIFWTSDLAKSDLKVNVGQAKSHFGMGTITLEQPFVWKSTDCLYLLVLGLPNPDQADWRMMDALISTEDLHYPWFPSVRFFRPGLHNTAAGSIIGSVRSVTTGIDPRPANS